ncbi:TetR/AcrR family transcriptional regulator [Sphingomonas gellani]|nr:TetR/AcrR family transcriptional regulator [Sphingomonas gellani]
MPDPATQAPAIKPQRAMRRDARARRDALLDAAALCFQQSGYLVPLEDIAEQAGVGRGTLYRNFRDREALALAIFGREIDRLAAVIDLEEPLGRTMAAVARSGSAASTLFARISSDMNLDEETMHDLKALGDRFVAVLQPVADRAHQRGELRPDYGAAELFLATRMAAALALKPGLDAEEQIANALDLLLRGLCAR